MVYVYLVIIGLYLLLFVLSRQENIAAYRNRPEQKTYLGQVLFYKAAAYCIRQKERLTERFIRRKSNTGRLCQEQFYKQQLGKNLKLLHPALSESYQVREFYIRQYSLILSVFFAGNLLSLCVALGARTTKIVQEGNYINRNAYGQGDIEVSLLAQLEEEEEKAIVYTVEEQKYTDEEIKLLFQEASAHLQKTILGENSSLDRVTEDLELITSMEEYPFQIFWESSSYSLVHTDGVVLNETLGEAQIVTLTAYFRYEDLEFEVVFPVKVYPAVFTEEELLMRRIENSLEEQNQASRTDSTMILPDQIGSKAVIWKEVIQDNSGYFFLLICIAALFIFISKNREVEQNLEKRRRELLLDYPEIVNKLILYMGAGMTIRNAFQKMGADYKKQKISEKKRYIYEEILLLCNELQSGVSETEAYAHLGKRCQLQSYMKFCTLLSQNLRKGSNDLLMLLRQEAEGAFEERKNIAKKLGEEAGTKLLIPMMMMLCIVMILIMIPAYFSFSA